VGVLTHTWPLAMASGPTRAGKFIDSHQSGISSAAVLDYFTVQKQIQRSGM
jgi:hypothetical protein